MAKAVNYRLSDEEFAALEVALHHDPRPEVRKRGLAIRLLHQGHKAAEVADLQAVSLPTVYGWFHRFKQDGVDGLAIKPRSGRPRIATDAYCQTLDDLLLQEPAALGYEFAIWTADRLRAQLEKQTGITLSARRLRAVLHQQGYRYRRPKHDLGHLQDKDAKAQAAALLEELKKRAQMQAWSSSLWTKPPSP
jgi:transposase